MKARVTKSFLGRADTEAITRRFQPDEIIGGELAAVAVREKWADELAEDAPATPPSEGEAARHAALVEAMRGLDQTNADLFTAAGAPKIDALDGVLDPPPSGTERDAAWAVVSDGGD